MRFSRSSTCRGINTMIMNLLLAIGNRYCVAFVRLSPQLWEARVRVCCRLQQKQKQRWRIQLQ